MKNHLFKILIACLISSFTSISFAQETPAQAINAAKASIEQAVKAGANKDAVDDLATANAWLAEAEKTNSLFNAVVTLTITDEARKARSEEIIYLAFMAKIKAQTAEAKAKKQSTILATQKVQKDLDSFLGALALAKNRLDEINKFKAELEKASSTIKELEAKTKEMAK